jgi:curved DNA-binding protein CbpA
MPPPADLARKKSIADRARWIDQEDYFKMLTVARDATTEDIRAAFLRSAKVWHPDTLPSSIADARPDAERVFARITTAYETLVDPEKRRAYEQSLDGTAPAKAKSEKRDDPGALHILRQAEMHMTLGERARAEDFVRRALVAQPDLSEAQAFLAYCEGLDPRFGSEDFLRGKVRAIDQVLARDPMTPRAHYYRAELCKRAGDHDEAVHDLRIAVTNDPDDVDAQRELKLYEKKLRDGVLQLRSLSPFPGLKKEKGLLDRFLKK